MVRPHSRPTPDAVSKFTNREYNAKNIKSATLKEENLRFCRREMPSKYIYICCLQKT